MAAIYAIDGVGAALSHGKRVRLANSYWKCNKFANFASLQSVLFERLFLIQSRFGLATVQQINPTSCIVIFPFSPHHQPLKHSIRSQQHKPTTHRRAPYITYNAFIFLLKSARPPLGRSLAPVFGYHGRSRIFRFLFDTQRGPFSVER